MTSSTTTVDYTFEWPAGPDDVVVTGEFDNWQGTLPLLKTSSGDFELTFPVKIPAGKEKVFFKFIVDGSWVTSDAYSKGSDENGIENNFISRIEALALSEHPVGTRIPEAGGLVFGATSTTYDEDAIPEPGAFPKTPVDRKVDEPPAVTSKSVFNPEPEAVASLPVVTGVSQTARTEDSDTKPTDTSVPEASVTTSASKPEPASLPTAVKTTEEATASTEAAKPEPAAIPSLSVKTLEPEESKPSTTVSQPQEKEVATPTITSPPVAAGSAGSAVVPETAGSTAAVKGTSLEPIPTVSSSDSKKRFKIKRRFKKNKLTGEKTIVSEERVPLDSEESGAEQPVVDEELLSSPTETGANEVHILPIDDPTQGKSTDFKPLAGEPGLVVPGNAAEIKEFSEVRDVDVDELNARLNKEEKLKETAAEEIPPTEVSTAGAQTLDPKTHLNELKPQTSNKLYDVGNNDSDAVKEEPEAAAATAVPASAPVKAKDSATAEKPAVAAKSEKKPAAHKTSSAAPKQEEKKKKGGFFSKLKKILH